MTPISGSLAWLVRELAMGVKTQGEQAGPGKGVKMKDEITQETKNLAIVLIVIVFLCLLGGCVYFAFEVADVAVDIAETGAEIVIEKAKKYNQVLEDLQKELRRLR